MVRLAATSFLKQVNRLTESQRNSITRAGFGNLLHIPNHVLRRQQLNELMERWNSERRAFVFPPGEITITPLDVVLILGLRVVGKPVVINEDAPFTSLEKEFGASVTNRTIGVESLKLRLESLGERDDEFFVRMFLLYCFGALLFPTTNMKVDSRYLYLFRDLDTVSCFAWGAAVLEDLHDCLSQRKTKRRRSFGGCLILLQIWCFEHIVVGRPKLLDCPSTFPRVCRWESSDSRKYCRMASQFAINFEELEHTQILWRLQPTSEELQVDIIREIPQEWYSRTTMEQPRNIEESQRATTTVLEEEDDEDEEILRTGPGTIKHAIDVASERPMRMVREEAFLRSGEGTMKHPIEVASKRASRMVRVPREEDHLQQKSTVLSDDEESKGMEDLKKENLELKEIIEDLRNENQVMKKRYEDQIEELKKQLEKHMLFVSNLERIVLEEDEDDEEDEEDNPPPTCTIRTAQIEESHRPTDEHRLQQDVHQEVMVQKLDIDAHPPSRDPDLVPEGSPESSSTGTSYASCLGSPYSDEVQRLKKQIGRMEQAHEQERLEMKVREAEMEAREANMQAREALMDERVAETQTLRRELLERIKALEETIVARFPPSDSPPSQ